MDEDGKETYSNKVKTTVIDKTGKPGTTKRNGTTTRVTRAVKTGDNSHTIIYLMLLIGAFAVIVGLQRKKRN